MVLGLTSTRERAFQGHAMSFFGRFIIGKGLVKYGLIYGAFALAAFYGLRATGHDIVDSTDFITHPVDELLSSAVGHEVTPLETTLLPFAYFVEHINSLSWQMAALELTAFSLIGAGLTYYGKVRHAAAR